MDITVLKAKLHQACVTHSELEYDGSCAIDGYLLNEAGIYEYQQIDLYNMTNGERFTTYAIRAEDHSRIISVNGAAAHKAKPGDRIIICAYAKINEKEISTFKPILVYFDGDNQIIKVKNNIPIQVA